MPKRKISGAAALALKTAEMATAVPQVVVHRIARMALAGPVPSARDQREFTRMVAEKKTAFNESWRAMATHTLQAQQAMALSMLTPFWLRRATTPAAAGAALATQWQNVALAVMGKGLAPVHRKATANARRLRTTRLHPTKLR